LYFKPGWMASIENKGNPNLSDRLEVLDDRGYIVAVLPSKANYTDPSEDKLVKWGDYLILELAEIDINYENEANKKVDTDNPVSGRIVNSYNISKGEIPDKSFGEEMRIGAILIK
ncbi:MAG: hypothetical protein NUK57_11315, partial [Gudongella sp.]|nr:hypothetical protein [Gudongella sp.]